MRKFALIFAIITGIIFPAVSFGADAVVLHVTETPKLSPDITWPTLSDDEVTVIEKGVLTFPAPDTKHYQFDTATSALQFAAGPQAYIEDGNFDFSPYPSTEYDDPDYSALPSAYSEVGISIETGEITSTVNVSSYPAVTDVTFTATRAITAPSGARHFSIGSGSTQTVTFSGITFSPNSDGTGGGVEVNAGTATFSGVTFNSCYTTGNGGGLLVTGGTVEVKERSSFSGCTADDHGGGLAVTGGDSVSVTSTTFTGNSAAYGGGFSLSGGSPVIDNTIFTGNSATNNGGAIYSASNLTIGANVSFDSTTASNTATNGGAIYVGGRTTTISGANVSFKGNEADYGGAVYVNSGGLVLSGSGMSFTENTASSDGGAIYEAGGNTVTISGSDIKIEQNSAVNGGAVYLANARAAAVLNITGTNAVEFNINRASNNGGAIYAEANVRMSFTPEVTFSGNTADSNGGALWFAVPSQLPEGTLHFTGNTAVGDGGAIYAQGSSSVTIGPLSSRNYTFSGNTAGTVGDKTTGYGGAFYTRSGDVTFEGYVGDNSITAQNTAAFGGFAASREGRIQVKNSFLGSQHAYYSGGAVWAENVVVESADFGSKNNPNESQYAEGNNGGGAIYSNSTITINNANFSSNSSQTYGGAIYAIGTVDINTATFENNESVNDGGAVYAYAANVTIDDAYFCSNKSTGNGNGGALSLFRFCTTSITNSTFYDNSGNRVDGGAIYAQGTIEIDNSYFSMNRSQKRGGAIFFAQSSATAPYGTFSVSNSMFSDNSTKGQGEDIQGGAICVVANTALITSCTFNKNRILPNNANVGEGGAVYLDTSSPYQSESNRIENCTFYENSIGGGSESSGGGALSIHCLGATNVVSSTFSMNDSHYKGGAIYIGAYEGTVTLSGTLTVGNTITGTYDIWSDGNIATGGYNRIGVYGTGSGITDFYSETKDETDRTGYPSKNWSKETFFGSNALAVNARTDLGSEIPPYIGSSRDGQDVRLLTLMLNEADTLPLADRATNVIPYSRRVLFPGVDERGVSRVSGGSSVGLDVGACFFDGTRPNNDNPPISSYTITKVEISGIPNNLRRVGQTASLIAKVYYSNGRTALGGTGDGEEPIEWSSDKPNIIRINKDTGDITVLNFTPANTYVTITAKTIRTDLSGAQVADSQPIRVTEYTYSYLNTTPQIMNYINDYIEDIAEYDISLQLPDVSSSYVSSSSFQSAFASTWGGVSASQVTDISDGSLTLNKQTTGYTTSDGFKSAKNIAVNVNMRNRNTGDVFPLTYAWMFSGSELDNILGYNLSGRSLTDEVIDTIFSTLRLDFQGAATSLPVIGTGGVKASEARAAGVLTLEKSDAEKGLRAELTAYLANVSTSSGVASSASDGPQLIPSGGTKLLVVPDGSGNDGAIYGTMWAASKSDADSGSNNSNSNSNNNGSSNSSSGGGGGGCNAGWLGGIVAGIFIFAKRHKDVQES